MSERARLLLDMLLLFASGFAVCLALTPFVRWLAIRVGLVDRPDGRRKIHAEPTPVAGGVAVFISAAAVLLLGLLRLSAWPESLAGNETIFRSLLAACAVIVGVGVIDDAWGLRGRTKLLGQLVAVGIVIAGGVHVDGFTIFNYRIDLGQFWSVVFTGFFLIGAINSLNLIDGMDGFLGSVGAILCLTIGALAFIGNNHAAACAAVTLAGALLGFLWYNFPPATIFLGDAGSMLIGLVVGTLAIQASLKGPATVGLALPVSLMIVPIFDTTAAIVRRKLTGRSILTTDRGHLHHVLRNSGFSNQQVIMLGAILTGLAGLGAVISQYLKNELFAIGSLISIVGFLIAFKLFGHSEYQLIKQRISAMMLRSNGDAGQAHQIKVHLQGKGDWEQIWNGLTVAADELGLTNMCLDVNAPAIHEGYHARWERTKKPVVNEVGGFWRVEIPLSARGNPVGRLEVIGLRDGDSARHKLASLATVVEDVESAIEEMCYPNEQSPPAA